MLRQQLTSRVASIILERVREKKGRLTEISDESRINRKYFNVEGFKKLRLHQLLRLLYALCLELTAKDFEETMDEIRDAVEEFADKYDYDLLDE